jgi:hypothetical protein
MAIEKSIKEILHSIDNDEYTIPEFQRGYVWNSTQVKEFFRSLYLGYPSGSFLIWKTKEPSKIRGDQKETNSVFHQLILDGQQRLTTIYTIFKGKTPDWYEGASLRTDLYFNLKTEEFEYFMQRKMSNKPEWLNVSEFLSDGGVESFIPKLEALSEEYKKYYLKNIVTLNKLSSISSYGYYIKEITITEIDKVVEIFNLVNKTGTTLNESDLALAIITSNWPEIKDRFRVSIEEYRKYNYDLSFRFLTRCLNILTTGRGKYTSELSNVTKDDFEEAWKKLNKILPHLINILRENAFIDSSDDFSSVYVLYVFVYYLSRKEFKFQSTEEANKAIYWMFTALLWGRYSGSSEAYLEKDMNILKETNSLDGLISEMHLYRGANLYLRPEDLAMQGVRSRIFNIFYASVRAQGAKDWTNPAVSLYSKSVGYNNKLQRHHIFPKAFLYKKYNGNNSIHKSIINEIANIAFITQQSNMEILDRDPNEYLPKIDASQLRSQFVPTDESLYTIDTYENFLEARRELLCKGINKFLSSYYNDENQNGIPDDLEHYDEKIEDIELSLRDLISHRLDSSAELDSYQEYVPQHLKDKAEVKIKKWISKNPGEEKSQFLVFRRKLDFFDFQEYFELISAKSVWPLFEETFVNKANLQSRFNQLGELRNSIRHSRGVTEIAIKDGEAALSWFNSILKSSTIKSEELE